MGEPADDDDDFTRAAAGPGHDPDDFTRAVAELGDPDAVFRISRGRFLAKLWLGVGLILGGAAVGALAFAFGVGGLAVFGKFVLTLPVFGVILLVQMYRQRGLLVLVYPTGLLRLCRGEVTSFPWDEVKEVRLKVQRAAPEVEADDAGNVTACWLPAEAPTVQIWNAKLVVVRKDGTEATFGPALADYPRLAELVQRRTFPAAWAEARARFRAGEPVAFGDPDLGLRDLEVTPTGLRFATQSLPRKKALPELFLPWKKFKEVVLAQGMLSVKQVGRWVPWLMLDIRHVPNPHVLFPLVAEARRLAPAPARQPDEGE
jgi:hypothetical protein